MVLEFYIYENNLNFNDITIFKLFFINIINSINNNFNYFFIIFEYKIILVFYY